MRLQTRYLAMILLATTPPAFALDFFAGQLTAENMQQLPDGGLDAVGGLGDWLLSNGELCAVVSGADHATYLALEGGSLVDLWHCDLANDQWTVAHSQLNLQKDQIPPAEQIQAGTSKSDAWLETRGSRDGLETTVQYRLSRDNPQQLQITTSIKRRAPGAALTMFGAMVLHPRAALRPFSIDSVAPGNSRGFDHPDVDTTDTGSIMSSVSSTDLQILLGSPHIQPTISYGVKVDGATLTDAKGKTRDLNTFMIGGRDFTMFGAFSRPFPGFWPRTPGLVSFAIGQLFDLNDQEEFTFRETIHVAPRADAAVFTDALFSGDTVTGQLDTNQAGILISDTDAQTLTYLRPNEDGSFAARLPANITDFRLRVESPWSTTYFEGNSGSADLGALSIGAPARLLLPQGSPMSLLFSKAGEQHIFHNALTPLTIGGTRLLGGPEDYRLNLSGTSADPVEAQLPPGSYDVLASHGPEYSVTATRIELTAGEPTTLTIDPPTRQVLTPGLIGVDFHVHSGVSFDSSLQPRQRVIDFVAQGGEVLVPTEHNVTYDIQPVIAALGLSTVVHSFPGVEITGMARSAVAPTTIGHSNVFPVEVDSDAFMGGTLPFEGKRLGQVIGSYKERYPASVYQLNHPRTVAFDDDITFFNHLSQGKAFDPEQALATEANSSLIETLPGTRYRDIDFDAMELLNGESMDIYKLVRTDWFALLKQNQLKVATANSDSHVSSQLVAYPRSYVEVENDDPGSVKTEEIIAALKRGALYGSTGPILRVAMNDAGPGSMHIGKSGTLSIAVATAGWIEASQARIWINGELSETLSLNEEGRTQVEITASRDSFVFVEVWGEASDEYARILPGFEPFAFANPIFIDVSGNGWRYNEE